MDVRVFNEHDLRYELRLKKRHGRWEAHTPHTSVSTHDAKGRKRKVGWLSIKAEDEGVRRIDSFGYYDSMERTFTDGRTWGTLAITVDQEKINIVMPSSLLKWGHAGGHKPRPRATAEEPEAGLKSQDKKTGEPLPPVD